MYGIGEKIISLRKKNKITQDELANALKISKQSILNYETEKRQVPIDILAKIANFFKIPIEAFFSEEFEDFKKIETEKDSVRIPIYSNASAGLGENAQEEPLDYLELPKVIAKNADFGSFVEGDSMEPKIYTDDLLLIRKLDSLEDGEIGVFYLNEKIFCKKFKFNPLKKEITLIPLNKKYDSIRVEENDDFHIIGKVVGVIDYTI